MRRHPWLFALLGLLVAGAAALDWACHRESGGPPRPSPTPARAKTPTPTPAGAGEVLVAAVQCPSELGDVAGNLARLERLTREAAARGARIVVLPEAAVTGYLSQDLRTNWRLPGRPLDRDFARGRSPAGVAQTVPGEATERFGRLARELGLYVVVPFVEVEPASGRYFNTACLIGPDGALLLHYRKLNPWPYPEDSWATSGDRGLAVLDTPYGRLGLCICYDVHTVPEELAGEGVETLLYPIAWVDELGSDWFERSLPQVAQDCRMNIVGANWSVERKQRWAGYGMSRIIDRDGRILARAATETGEEILYARLKVGERKAAEPTAPAGTAESPPVDVSPPGE